MVERQLRRRGIADECVLGAMAAIPREVFLPDEVRGRAYRDGAVPIGEGQTMSQPWIVACMSSLLELSGEEVVLEVGTGSGYGAAVLSQCCSEVVTIERHPPLAERARAALAEAGVDNVEVRLADRIRRVNERLSRQTFQTVDGRVASALLGQVEAIAGGDGAREVLIRATQAQIAQLSGSSRESASRFLAKLERAVVITTGLGKILVHDPPSLRNYIY